MPALTRQRCLHHSTREAVARCPECGQFYCRECITEHDDRVICASCLKKVTQAAEAPSRLRLNLWPAAQGLGGFVLTWFFFYTVGRMLLSLPDEFHRDSMWTSKWMDSIESGRHE
jgi:hypothetical protein